MNLQYRNLILITTNYSEALEKTNDDCNTMMPEIYEKRKQAEELRKEIAKAGKQIDEVETFRVRDR